MKKNMSLSRSGFALGISLLLLGSICSAQWSSRGPAPRLGHSAVLDTATNKMIIFGGYTFTPDSPSAAHFNDVWYLTTATSTNPNETWQQVTPSGTSPSPRGGHTAVYDSANSRMIVFGGSGGFADPVYNDVWVLENANGKDGTPTWVELSPAGTAPSARFYHVAAYNPNSNRMIVFGGDNGDGIDFSDVWILENANGLGGTPTWVNFIPNDSTGCPSPRNLTTIAYDVADNVITLFGGFATATESLLNDTWVLFGADGTGSCSNVDCFSGPANPENVTQPSAREGQSSFYDAKTNTVHMFGGYNGTNILNDYWVLTGANNLSAAWKQVSPTGTAPLPRFNHTSVYDSSNYRMIIFGGEIATNGLLTDTVNILSDANTQ